VTKRKERDFSHLPPEGVPRVDVVLARARLPDVTEALASIREGSLRKTDEAVRGYRWLFRNGFTWEEGDFAVPRLTKDGERLVEALATYAGFVKGDRVTFRYQGEEVTGPVVLLKADVLTVDVRGSHSNEDVGWVDVQPGNVRRAS